MTASAAEASGSSDQLKIIQVVDVCELETKERALPV